MEWLARMNDAVEYIEEGLAGEIDYQEIARRACCSVYHFQRMFSYMAEAPLSDYIRGRRLASAAFDLQNSAEKVVDLALKYGYDSPTAFTRAFKKMRGITPNEAREQGTKIKAYPPISFYLRVKGATIMEYRIEEKEAFRTVGAKLSTTIEGGKSYEDVPKFWAETAMSGTMAKIMPLMNSEPLGLMGISACNAVATQSEFDYYIAVSSTSDAILGTEEFTVPACTWAIFECVGVQSLIALQKRIVTEWLPTSGYEYADAPDIEMYLDDHPGHPELNHIEVWLPVTNK